MNNRFYSEAKIYSIFALINADEHAVYIGKTASPRLSAVYSRHARGELEVTKGFFDTDDERPELHLLEILETTGADAYRHVLAWTNIFRLEGFHILGYDRTIQQAMCPRPETKQIIEKIRQHSIDRILCETEIEFPCEADRLIRPYFRKQKTEENKPDDKLVQMNIRLSETDKNQLNAFRDHAKLTQAEAMHLLLDHLNADPKRDKTIELLSARDAQIRQLQDEVRHQRERIIELRGEPGSQAQKLLTYYQRTIDILLKRLFPADIPGVPLRPQPYKKYMRRLPPECSYEYPAGEGCVMLRLDALLLSSSRTRATFVVGTTAAGEHYRLRYYPRAEYVGMQLLDNPYASAQSEWLFMYIEAPDGAKDIMAAFPLANTSSSSHETAHMSQTKSSLDGLIARAESRRK